MKPNRKIYPLYEIVTEVRNHFVRVIINGHMQHHKHSDWNSAKAWIGNRFAFVEGHTHKRIPVHTHRIKNRNRRCGT